MTTRWRLRPFDPDRVALLGREAGLSPLIAQLLLGRGVADAPTAAAFFETRLVGLHDPETLPGVVEAAEDRNLHVDTWLMSCRVLGRKVEEATLNVLLGRSRAHRSPEDRRRIPPDRQERHGTGALRKAGIRAAWQTGR